jgi:folate-dependent phosphoribosylglycinamide formyltransferase PurN
MTGGVRVVFLVSDYVLHNGVVSAYLAARPDDQVAVVKVPLVLKGKGRRDSARRIAPRLSRRFLMGKLVEYAGLQLLTWCPKLQHRGPVFRRLRGLARHHGLPFLRSEDVLSTETLAFLEAQRPDVVVSLFHQILKEPLISLPRLGVVNIHPGLLPEVRGIQPYFWALSEGHGAAGCTLHLIEDASIDTGGVLASARFPVEPGDSVQLTYWRTARVAAELLPRCLTALEAGQLTPRAQDPDAGGYFRWPDSAAYDRLTARGHGLLGWRHLAGILTGRHDQVDAESHLELASASGQETPAP